MEVAQVSISSTHECVQQLWYVYTMQYYLAIKKKKILPFVTVWMGLENIILSEISQPEEDKYHMITLICGMQWTYWPKKQNRNRLMDGEQMSANCGVWGGGIEQKEQLMDVHNKQGDDCRGRGM